MRVIFFGMPGSLAAHALAALHSAGAELVAIMVPAPAGAPPVTMLPLQPRALPAQIALSTAPAQPPPPLAVAAAHGIPALALRQMGALAVEATVTAVHPDLAVVACWPWRIPPALLAVSQLGFLNLHPSPLPELRGPEPLFWALREGRTHSAVCLHWMDEGLDTGPIAAEAPFELALGASWAELERQAALTAAALLAGLVPRLVAGELPRRPQGSGGSYRPAPAAADFSIDPAWPAHRAFGFMRGTAGLGVPFTLAVGDSTLRLGAAVGYSPHGELGAPVLVAGGLVRVQMTPGVLEATLLG